MQETWIEFLEKKVVLVEKWNYKNFLIAKYTSDLNHVTYDKRVGHSLSSLLKNQAQNVNLNFSKQVQVIFD